MKLYHLASGCAALVLAGCATLDAPEPATPIEVQILALNDFHGALQPHEYETAWVENGAEKSEVLGGAARLATLLDRLRQGQRHSITVAAGDLISASPIISSRFLDEPAIAALNLAGLAISSVGNHEFDRGVPELRRMQEGGCEKLTVRDPCALEPFAGAAFAYLAGNTVAEDGETLFAGSAMREFGPVRIGFVGLTLRDTALLVRPSATAGYDFTDETEAANRLASDLLKQGADTVVLLIHEGAQVEGRNNLDDCAGLSGALLPILAGLDPSIEVVVSGHTHRAYSCNLRGEYGPVRLLTSGGANGAFVTEIALAFEPATGELQSASARNLPVKQGLDEAPAIAALVERYAQAAASIADRVVGSYRIESDATGDCWDDAAQRLVADAQLAAAGSAGADLAFVNSEGVRTPLPGGERGTLSFGQIYAMQPFGNALPVIEMSGSQLRRVLEQQFCEDDGVKPCFSYLAPSQGFAYSFDRTRPAGDRIVEILLDGAPLEADGAYRVVLANFLQSGGDGFGVFEEAEIVGHAGNDLDALEAWLAGGAVIGGCGRVRDLTPAGG